MISLERSQSMALTRSRIYLINFMIAKNIILQHSVKLVKLDNNAFKNIDRCVIF